jgi:prepilin-type N-terminal cleavage/methylation domain-containing protein/prepilin-type processing-associated H-X9-DG protein
MRLLQNRRSGFSAESRTLNLLEKCGGLPTAATMKGSFLEVSDNDLTAFPAMKELIAARRWQTGSARAFTLTELLVVLCVMAMLAAVLLSASFTTQEGVLRAECVSHLRQIGVGLNLYSAEANGYLPICNWPQGQYPWQTYTVFRCDPGTTNITRGPVGLGVLFAGRQIPNPRVFYCPSLGKARVQGTYEYYTYANGVWPSVPPLQPDGTPEVQVRTGYDYYPQPKETELVAGFQLPVLRYYTSVIPAPGQPELKEPVALKATAVDPNKTMAVDMLMKLADLGHKNNGQPAGANALFLDGHVKFQPVNGNSRPNQAFDKNIWNSCPDQYLGDDLPPYTNYRRVVSYFKP